MLSGPSPQPHPVMETIFQILLSKSAKVELSDLRASCHPDARGKWEKGIFPCHCAYPGLQALGLIKKK